MIHVLENHPSTIIFEIEVVEFLAKPEAQSHP
jgi:hypothetical protein